MYQRGEGVPVDLDDDAPLLGGVGGPRRHVRHPQYRASSISTGSGRRRIRRKPWSSSSAPPTSAIRRRPTISAGCTSPATASRWTSRKPANGTGSAPTGGTAGPRRPRRDARSGRRATPPSARSPRCTTRAPPPSTNSEPAQNGRKRLGALDKPAKLNALRKLIAGMDGADHPDERGRARRPAGQLAAKNNVKPASPSLDDTLIAEARAEWQSHNPRTNLF